MFIIEHYFAIKSFAAVLEEFSNTYPENEVQNNSTLTSNRDSQSRIKHRKESKESECLSYRNY